MDSPYYFEVDSLVTHLGKQTIFDELDLKIKTGESTVILGRSGAGKSVLLKHLLGLMKPSSGTIKIKGTDVTAFKNSDLIPFRKNMGILFQDGALFDFLTVAENVAFPLVESGIDNADELHERTYSALDRVGLAEHMKTSPLNLSGGMRKRVSLARAIISNPDCILCDEPTAGLDPVSANDISSLIRNLVDDHQATAVTVTHDISSMHIIADRVVMLSDGKITFSGTAEDTQNPNEHGVYEFVKGIS